MNETKKTKKNCRPGNGRTLKIDAARFNLKFYISTKVARRVV